MPTDDTQAIKMVLQKFQDGYTQRDIHQIDEIMQLFVDDPKAISPNAIFIRNHHIPGCTRPRNRLINNR